MSINSKSEFRIFIFCKMTLSNYPTTGMVLGEGVYVTSIPYITALWRGDSTYAILGRKKSKRTMQSSTQSSIWGRAGILMLHLINHLIYLHIPPANNNMLLFSN
jgi:hypothetical protein